MSFIHLVCLYLDTHFWHLDTNWGHEHHVPFPWHVEKRGPVNQFLAEQRLAHFWCEFVTLVIGRALMLSRCRERWKGMAGTHQVGHQSLDWNSSAHTGRRMLPHWCSPLAGSQGVLSTARKNNLLQLFLSDVQRGFLKALLFLETSLGAMSQSWWCPIADVPKFKKNRQLHPLDTPLPNIYIPPPSLPTTRLQPLLDPISICYSGTYFGIDMLRIAL